MSDLEYIVRCCRQSYENERERLIESETALDLSQEHNEKLHARCDALIALCTLRKPRSASAKRDRELIALLKEYPV